MSRIRKPGKLPYLKFPLHYKGAPQRRLFFPDWYVKILPHEEDVPKNYVRLAVPADMTKYDVKEYMKKIYNVPIAKVDLKLNEYKHYREPSGKHGFEEPWKEAMIRLGNGEKFEYPDILKDLDKQTTFEKTDTDAMDISTKQKEEMKSNDELNSHKIIGNKWFMQ